MPKYDPQRHNRRSIRLKGYDYSLACAYFVTICVQNGSDLLGEIADEEMVLEDPGQMVQETWESILHKFPMIQLDAFVIMPNHVHFIVFLTSPDVGVDLRVHPGQTGRRESA